MAAAPGVLLQALEPPGRPEARRRPGRWGATGVVVHCRQNCEPGQYLAHETVQGAVIEIGGQTEQLTHLGACQLGGGQVAQNRRHGEQAQ